MHALIPLILGVMSAHAACESDMDCKGTRVCEEGICVEPVTVPAPERTKTKFDRYQPELVWASRGVVLIDEEPATFEQAAEFLITTTQSAKYTARATSQRKLGRGLIVGSSAAATVGALLVTYGASTYSTSRNHSSSGDGSMALGFGLCLSALGIGTGFSAGLPVWLSATRNERKAVEAYSRNTAE